MSIIKKKQLTEIIQLLVHIYYPRSARAGYDIRSIFLSGVQQVSIQSFLSPRLVASPSLKNSACPTIYP